MAQRGIPVSARVPRPRSRVLPDRAFIRWVHAEARTLAGQLERLALDAVTPSGVACHAEALAAALAADADWARAHLDGRFEPGGEDDDGDQDGGGGRP